MYRELQSSLFGSGAQRPEDYMGEHPLTQHDVERLRAALGVNTPVRKGDTDPRHAFYMPPVDVDRISREERERLFQVLREVHMGAVPNPRFADWSQGAVYTSRQAHPGVLAHELGHAQHYETLTGKPLFHLKEPGMSVALAAPLLAMSRRAGKFAPLVAAGGVAPTLITEYEATRRGVNALEAAGYGDQAVGEAREMLGLKGALGTYAKPAGAVVGGAFGAQYLAKLLRAARR